MEDTFDLLAFVAQLARTETTILLRDLKFCWIQLWK